MDTEVAPDENTTKQSRKIPSWIWPVVFAELLRDTVPALIGVLIGIVTAPLILIRAGLLQLVRWPVAAIIALVAIDVVLVMLVFGLAMVYAVFTAVYIAVWIGNALFKKPLPKRPRWLGPIDVYALWSLTSTTQILSRIIRPSRARHRSELTEKETASRDKENEQLTQ